MGVRNPKLEELQRLEAKTLDARFRTLVRDGLGCSPFEAEAVLEAAKEVYGPALAEAPGTAQPGRMTLVVVGAEEPAGKPVVECEKVPVTLTVHRGPEDDQLLSKHGAEAFRQARLPDLCQEALSQGGLLTREDLAFRIFFVSPRTISRDLQALRTAQPEVPLPMRSTVHDIGPVLTHRVKIVQLALEGKTMTQICEIMRHSPGAVSNYLATFARCAYLARQGMQVGQIAFLLRRGRGLVRKYLELLSQCETDRNWQYHLDELLRVEGGAGEKKEGGC